MAAGDIMLDHNLRFRKETTVLLQNYPCLSACTAEEAIFLEAKDECKL